MNIDMFDHLAFPSVGLSSEWFNDVKYDEKT